MRVWRAEGAHTRCEHRAIHRCGSGLPQQRHHGPPRLPLLQFTIPRTHKTKPGDLCVAACFTCAALPALTTHEWIPDCTDTHDKQIVISVGEGAKAALAAVEYLVAQV